MILTASLLAYFLGSIPFGLLLTRMAGMGDIRKFGSGNIGATNVMRTGHKGLGLLTLLLDGGKGYAAMWCAQRLHPGEMADMAGLMVVLGHVFPVWLRFKGGKGVATAIGVFFGLNWMLGFTVCVIWLLAFALMRIASLASMLGLGYSPIAAYVLDNDAVTLLSLILAMLVVFTHRGNIMRLLLGTERHFSGKGSDAHS